MHQDGTTVLPPGFWEHVLQNGIFVLGICYGLQLMVQMLGGEVKPAESQEYVREICVQKGSSSFQFCKRRSFAFGFCARSHFYCKRLQSDQT